MMRRKLVASGALLMQQSMMKRIHSRGSFWMFCHNNKHGLANRKEYPHQRRSGSPLVMSLARLRIYFLPPFASFASPDGTMIVLTAVLLLVLHHSRS